LLFTITQLYICLVFPIRSFIPLSSAVHSNLVIISKDARKKSLFDVILVCETYYFKFEKYCFASWKIFSNQPFL